MTKSTKAQIKAEAKQVAKPVAKQVAKPIAKPMNKQGTAYPCSAPGCPKSYLSAQSLAKHKRNNHSDLALTPPTRGRPAMTEKEILLRSQENARTIHFTLFSKDHPLMKRLNAQLEVIKEVYGDDIDQSVSMKYQKDNYDNVYTDSGKAYAGASHMSESLNKAFKVINMGTINTLVHNMAFNSPANVDMRSQVAPDSESINGGTAGRMSSGSMRMSSGSLHDLPSRDNREHGPTPASDCFTFGQPISGKKGPTFGNGKRMVDLPIVQKAAADKAHMRQLDGVRKNFVTLFESMDLDE